MKTRKTIELKKVKDQANCFLLNSKNELQSARFSLQHFVAGLLIESGGYKGFGYLRKEDVAEGSTYGIEINPDGSKKFPDESRVHFY